MNRMGGPQPDYTPDGVLAEIARVVPFFKGATWTGLGDNGKQWPIQEGCVGTEILHTETFKRGLGKFHFFRFQESREIVQHHGEFPFILTTGRVIEHYNCGTMTRRTGNAQIVTKRIRPTSSTSPAQPKSLLGAWQGLVTFHEGWDEPLEVMLPYTK